MWRYLTLWVNANNIMTEQSIKNIKSTRLYVHVMEIIRSIVSGQIDVSLACLNVLIGTRDVV